MNLFFKQIPVGWKYILLTLAVAIIANTLVLYWTLEYSIPETNFPELKKPSSKIESITSFEDCATAGYPVMESYPRQCRAPGGQLFIEEVEDQLFE